MPKQRINNAEFLTIKQIAEKCSVSYAAVYNWVRKGMIPAYKIGSIYRVRIEDFEEFLKSMKLQ